MDLTNRFKVYDEINKKWLSSKEISERVCLKYNSGTDGRDWVWATLEADKDLTFYYAKDGKHYVWKPINSIKDILINN